MSFRAVYSQDDIFSGEEYWLAQPEWRYGLGSSVSEGIVFAHGAGQLTQHVLDTPEQVSILHKLAKYYTVLVADLGDAGNKVSAPYTAWGNDACESRISNARAFLQDYQGVTGKITLMSVSMGTAAVMNYALNNPSDVRGVVSFIPALDLNDLSVNRGFTMITDNTYYSSASSQAAMHANNPVEFASSLDSDIPMLLITASDDAITVPSTADAFVAARPTTSRYNVGALGHSFASVAAGETQALDFVRNLTL